MTRIILIGLMGCGKTTIGKQIAKRLDLPFIDSDEEISSMTGLSINELFEERGEAAFRELERSFIQSLRLVDSFVLATGGGLPVIPGMMTVLNNMGTTIFLQVSPYELADRLTKDSAERPLLKKVMKNEYFDFISYQYFLRLSFYLNATIVICQETISVDEVIEAFTKYMEK